MVQPTTGQESVHSSSWRVERFTRLLALLPSHPTRPVVLAVDGRGGAGKTALAERFREAVPGATVVHTDDVAWHLALFDWVDPLVTGVLEPARRGAPVRYRPVAWDKRSRPGAIEVPTGCPLLILEGSGSGRRQLAPWLDVVVWVHAGRAEAERRLATRDGSSSDAVAFRAEWAAQEHVFFAQERTWARADLIVAGTTVMPLCPITEVAVSGCGPGTWQTHAADASRSGPAPAVQERPDRPTESPAWMQTEETAP